MDISDIISILLVALLIALLIGVIISTYLCIRTEWLFNKKNKILLNKGIADYNKVLDYNTIMFKKFWIWDIEKLKKENK